jgi:hypothetical protein
MLLSAIHKLLILFGIKKHCLISGRSQLLYQSIKRLMKLIAMIIMRYQLSTSCKMLSSIPGIDHLLAYTDDVNLLIYNLNTIEKHRERREKHYMLLSRNQNAGEIMTSK